jgi:aldose 1-epimerase
VSPITAAPRRSRQRGSVADASGSQHVIAWEDQEAVVAGVGGGPRLYEADGRQVLDGYRADEMCPDARGQLLVPWPGSLDGGRYRFGGRQHQLPLSDPEAGAARDGLLRWSGFAAADRGPSWVTMAHRLHPRPGYPFLLDVLATYGLSDGGLRADLRVENRGGGPAPVGAGQRACLLRLEGTELEVPAGSRLAVDARGLPTGREALAGDDLDYRSPRALGPDRFEAVYADLGRDQAGVCSVRLRGRRGALRVWMDRGFRYVAISAGGPGCALAVTPMTCPPNALASGEDLAILEPGQRLQAAWGIEVQPIVQGSR